MAGRVSGVKMGDEGDGSLISPDGVAPNWIVGVSASVISPLHHKVQKKFLLLAPAHPGSPGKRPVVCVCVYPFLCYLPIGLVTSLCIPFIQELMAIVLL